MKEEVSDKTKPECFTPFAIRELTENEHKSQYGSPTHSILKSPTAVFSKSEDFNKSGKRLTFAESPEYNDSPTRTIKTSVTNGGSESSQIAVAVSPNKSIQVSPESWKAYLAYQRCYEDYSNETVKTDFTYSPVSPFHNREIVPGIPMRPNMSRLPLHGLINSAPTTRLATPKSSRIQPSEIVSASSLASSINKRLTRWKRETLFVHRKKLILEDETNNSLWWWILLFLFILGGLWISQHIYLASNNEKLENSLSKVQYIMLLERFKILELAVTDEINKRRNFTIYRLLEALKISRAHISTTYRRCCRSMRKLMLSNLNRIEEQLKESYQDQYLRLLKHENRLHELSNSWTSEIDEMYKSLIDLKRESYTPNINNIIADMITRYDADKTGRADFALESSGGRVASIRCTQPWPGDKEILSFDPTVAIRRDVAPGQCWAFQGEGHLLLELSHAINVSGASIEHIPSAIHPHGHTASAPKNFTLLGLKNENDESPHFFGQYIYNIEAGSNTIQYFKVNHPNANLFKYVELVISSNHGHPYTCLYRIRIHGVLPQLRTD